FIGLGLALMAAVAQIEMRFWRRWAAPVYLLGLALLVMVLVIGVVNKGARRWLDFPGLPSFQPSELMKVFVPLTVAWFLARTPLPPRLTHVSWSLFILGLPAVLIGMQPDLGTALLIACSGLFVLLLAGIPWRLVFTVLRLAVAS